jgi:hypothetical protein
MAVKTAHSPRRAPQEEQGRSLSLSGQLVIGLLFLIALVAFEIFNFDTTQFALRDFLGTASFAGVQWATVLALAFCAIDFAGLLRFFLPEDEHGNTPLEVWYLMGAWLLGATMNALMTWWAVNLALLNHEFGNEVLSRQQLLEIVPIFVAVLVWITRILFIGAFTVAGGYLFDLAGITLPATNSASKDKAQQQKRSRSRREEAPALPRAVPLTLRPLPRGATSARDLNLDDKDVPDFLERHQERAWHEAELYEYEEDEPMPVDHNRGQEIPPTRVSRRPRRTRHDNSPIAARQAQEV